MDRITLEAKTLEAFELLSENAKRLVFQNALERLSTESVEQIKNLAVLAS